MQKFKVMVKSSDLSSVKVFDDSTGQEIPSMSPPSTDVLAVVEIHQDQELGGCWWVRQDTSKQWWGWRDICPSAPEIMIKIEGDGDIKEARLDNKKLNNNVGSPSQPSRKLRFTVEEDRGKPLAACRYVVIGGKAYRIC